MRTGSWALLALLTLTSNADVRGAEREPRYKGKPLSAWMAQLPDKNGKFDDEALEALWKIGPEARDAVPAVLDALKSPNGYTRHRAALALAGIGPDACKAIGPLLTVMTEDREDVADSAMEALCNVGRGSIKELRGPLLLLRKDPRPTVRKRAEIVLTSLQPLERIPSLIESLKDPQYAGYRVGAPYPVQMLALLGKPGLKALVGALQHRDPAIRKASVAGVARIGTPAVAVPALTRALRDQDAAVRGEAADSLGRLGPAASSAASPLGELLKDEEMAVQLAAEAALRALDPRRRPDLALFQRALKHREARLREDAALRLFRLGAGATKAIPALTVALDDADQYVRSGALSALQGTGEQGGKLLRHRFEKANGPLRAEMLDYLSRAGGRDWAVPLLLATLDGADKVNQRVARAALRRAVLTPRAIPDLVAGLRHKNDLVRTEAAEALLELGAAKEARAALVKALKDRVVEVRFCAARALSTLGPAGKEAIPVLLEALKDRFSREEAQLALLQLGKEALPALTTALRDRSPVIREQSAETLARMGLRALPALEALSQAATHADPDTRRAAMHALEAIGPAARSTVPLLTAALRDQDTYFAAATALGAIDRNAAEAAVPVLLPLLKHKRIDMRECGVWALGKLGPAAKEAVPALVEAYGDVENRLEVARALGHISPGSKETLSILQGMLRSPRTRNRCRAAAILGEMGTTPAVIDLLRNALKDEDPDVRVASARALGQIGPAARAAVPDLVEIVNDQESPVYGYFPRQTGYVANGFPDEGEDEDVRAVAAAALQRIDPDKEEDEDIRPVAAAALKRIAPAAQRRAGGR